MQIVEGKVVIVESHAEEEGEDGCHEDSSEDRVNARVEKSLENHVHSWKMPISKRKRADTQRRRERK